MVKEQKLGKNTRMSFAKINELCEMPNLIEVQKESFQWFLEKGIKEVLHDISPIMDHSEDLCIEFVSYTLDVNKPKYPVEECKVRDVNYAAPLRVNVRLSNRLTGEVKEHEVFMGDFPLMTDNGTFVINGAERVVVSQIVRSPGMYYEVKTDRSDSAIYSATVIPYRGAWLEYETDLNDIFYIRIDKNRKLPITSFIRALGLATDEQILGLFGEDERIIATLEKDPSKTEEAALIEIYKRLRPGEPPTIDGAKTLIHNLFFDARRYDLSNVGRYKYNKKMSIVPRIANRKLMLPVVDPCTGEIIADRGNELPVSAFDDVVDGIVGIE